jgi:hypothetical protein
MIPKSTSPSPINLFCFGFSYTAEHLICHLKSQNIDFTLRTTSTRDEKKQRLLAQNIKTYTFNEFTPLADASIVLKDATHILISIPPTGEESDIVTQFHAETLKELPNLKWIGYLSTTGVYGNRNGETVTEESRLSPTSKRGSRRVAAEQKWLDLYKKHDLPIHIFRLSGIYGKGRSAIDSVLGGNARRIYKKGHVFNRIHVDDIAQVLKASMLNPQKGSIYNLADDLPAPSHDIITYACELLGRPALPLIDIEDADLSPMAQSFYNDHKIVINNKIKDELGVTLKYPDYKSGLKSCLACSETNKARPLFGTD